LSCFSPEILREKRREIIQCTANSIMHSHSALSEWRLSTREMHGWILDSPVHACYLLDTFCCVAHLHSTSQITITALRVAIRARVQVPYIIHIMQPHGCAGHNNTRRRRLTNFGYLNRSSHSILQQPPFSMHFKFTIRILHLILPVHRSITNITTHWSWRSLKLIGKSVGKFEYDFPWSVTITYKTEKVMLKKSRI